MRKEVCRYHGYKGEERDSARLATMSLYAGYELDLKIKRYINGATRGRTLLCKHPELHLCILPDIKLGITISHY